MSRRGRRAECVQEAVYRISHTAHMVDNLQELLGAIHEIVGELMPAKNFYVSLYDAEHDSLEFPTSSTSTTRPATSRRASCARGLTEYVLRTESRCSRPRTCTRISSRQAKRS